MKSQIPANYKIVKHISYGKKTKNFLKAEEVVLESIKKCTLPFAEAFDVDVRNDFYTEILPTLIHGVLGSYDQSAVALAIVTAMDQNSQLKEMVLSNFVEKDNS